MDSNVQFHTSHETLKDFAYDTLFAFITLIKLSFFSNYDHAFRVMNFTCKNDYDFHNMFEGKCTNVSCCTFFIYCAWVYCSSHLNSIFFIWLIDFFFISCLPCTWIIQIRTFMKIWFCCLSPLKQIDEHWIYPFAFETYMFGLNVNETTI